MSNKLLSIVLVTGVLGACGGGDHAKVYSELDTDKDGYISKDEGVAMEGLSESWATLDTNLDGQLDEAEFAKFEIGQTPEQAPQEVPETQATPDKQE